MLDIRDHGGKFGGVAGGKNIKSLQSGTVTPFNNTTTTTHNIPITAIDVSKSIVRISYFPQGSAGASAAISATLSDSSVRLNRYGKAQSMSWPIYWEVIEFENVKSKQIGNSPGNGNISYPITISPVDVSKTLIFHSQISLNTNAIGMNAQDYSSGLSLTNSTTLNITGSDRAFVDYQIIEFK